MLQTSYSYELCHISNTWWICDLKILLYFAIIEVGQSGRLGAV